MTELIAGLARLILRLVLVAAGLIFAAALVVALLLFVAFWMLRAGWARLTGKPVTPFVMRMDPRTGFGYVFRAGQGRPEDAGWRDAAGREEMQQPGTPLAGPRRAIADVTDVQPKEPRS